MNLNPFKRLLVILVAYCASAVPFASSAQDLSSYPLPDEAPVVDGFGVQILAARWSHIERAGLESPIDPDLKYYRMAGASGAAWGSTLQSYVVSASYPGIEGYYYVTIGNTNTMFVYHANSNTWSEAYTNGNSLIRDVNTGKLVFISRNGVRYTFDQSIFQSQPTGSLAHCQAGRPSLIARECAALERIDFPNGKTHTFEYTVRAVYDDYSSSSSGTSVYMTYASPRSVHSSMGISIRTDYPRPDGSGQTGAAIINDALVNCDYHSVNSCSSSVQWPSTFVSSEFITSPSGTRWYVYTSTDSEGRVATYEIQPNGRTFIAHSGGVGTPATVTFANDQGGQDKDGPNYPTFINYTDANGQTYLYRYHETWTTCCVQLNVTRTAPDGSVHTFIGDDWTPRSELIVQDADELGRVRKYSYGIGRNLAKIEFPEGNFREFGYDARANMVSIKETAKPGTGSATRIWNFFYPSSCTNPITCNKPTSATDPKGARTDFWYDPIHGGLISEMKAAPTTGAPRPLKLATYVQKYAYIKNASGTLVPATSPVWLPATVTECQTAAGSNTPVCDGAAPQKVTTNQYGADGTANNLLLRGIAVTADGVTRRTCYGYDTMGRKVSETTPNANLGVCP